MTITAPLSTASLPTTTAQPNKWFDCHPVGGKCSNKLHTNSDKRVRPGTNQCRLGRSWSLEAPTCPGCGTEFPEHFGRLLNPVLIDRKDSVIKPTVSAAASALFMRVIVKPNKEICPDCAAALEAGVNARTEHAGKVSLKSGDLFPLLLVRKDAKVAIEDAKASAKAAMIARVQLACRQGWIPFGRHEWRGDMLYHECVMAVAETNLCLATTPEESWEPSTQMAGKVIKDGGVNVPLCRACASALEEAGAEIVRFRIPRSIPPRPPTVSAPKPEVPTKRFEPARFVAPPPAEPRVHVDWAPRDPVEEARRRRMEFVAPVPGRATRKPSGTPKMTKWQFAARQLKAEQAKTAQPEKPGKGKKNKGGDGDSAKKGGKGGRK